MTEKFTRETCDVFESAMLALASAHGFLLFTAGESAGGWQRVQTKASLVEGEHVMVAASMVTMLEKWESEGLISKEQVLETVLQKRESPPRALHD